MSNVEKTSAAAMPAPAPAHRALAMFGHALPWIIAVAYYVFVDYIPGGSLSIGTQIMIWILFAMSLDLVLGYAGIVTLGHAVFYGVGAYAAGLLSIHLTPDPVVGHLLAILICGQIGRAHV